MFGIPKPKNKAHAHQRELRTLMSCIVAWRRACLESYHLNGQATVGALNERIDLLGLYINSAGGADPFTTQLLQIGVGDLPESWFLEALFRLETAVSVAWALRLLENMPDIQERADHDLLGSFFPTDGPPSPLLAKAALRPEGELSAMLAEWAAISATARKLRDASPEDEGAGIQFSRAFERTRGLVWVSSNSEWIEDGGEAA